MGKFIQPSKRTMSPIFPQMSSPQQQRMSREVNAPKVADKIKEPPKPEKVFEKEQRTAVKKNVSAEKTKEKKKMTASQLRDGFKMSIIIGDPVSKKYRRFK